MKFPEINTLEDLDKTIEVSQWDLLEVAAQFHKKGIYIGIWIGFGLVLVITLIRNTIGA